MKPDVEYRDEIIHVSNKQMTRLYNIVNEDIGVSDPKETAYTKNGLIYIDELIRWIIVAHGFAYGRHNDEDKEKTTPQKEKMILCQL